MIDHRGKEIAIIATQVTYETDYISLLRDSIMSNALNFCSFLVFYWNLKKKKISSKKNVCT